MIGRGHDRNDDLTLWDVTTFGGERVWTSVDFPPYDESGYYWSTLQTMRWGTNVIEDDMDIQSGEFDANHTIVAAVEEVDVIAIGTRFDELVDAAATPFESHATLGDSGGGVFYNNGSQWELAGIMLAVSVLEGQPENTAVFGNITVAADLSAYRDQILSIISRPALQAGDANQDLTFDQLDLVKVAQTAKYMTGATATWGDGDWNGAPGGSVGNPPVGDGVFNQLDMVAALQNGLYLGGPYAARADQRISETALDSDLPSLQREESSRTIDRLAAGRGAGAGRLWPPCRLARSQRRRLARADTCHSWETGGPVRCAVAVGSGLNDKRSADTRRQARRMRQGRKPRSRSSWMFSGALCRTRSAAYRSTATPPRCTGAESMAVRSSPSSSSLRFSRATAASMPS